MAGLATDVEAYREYVVSRIDPMRRLAYLLCGDWHTADDLLSTALVKAPPHRAGRLRWDQECGRAQQR